MPEFDYKGINRKGLRVSGKLDAPNEGEVRVQLRSLGIRPIKIAKAGSIQASYLTFLKGGLRNVPIEAIVVFTRQLQLLIGSGIPLVQGLEMLQEQASDSTLRTIISSVREKVSQGSYFWESIAAYPSVFPKLYVALIRAGEASGAMDQMLRRLSRYVEDADRMKKMVKSAMMYPIFVLLIGTGIVSVMLVFVIPKFEEMLKNGHQELPLPTAVLIQLSHFFQEKWHFIIGTVLAISYVVTRYLKTEEGRAFWDRVIFKVPVFGPMQQKSGVARFARTLQTLLNSGVNLIDALDICKATVDNAVLEEAVGKIRGEIETGKTLGATLGKLDVFPRMAVQMISVGESTGNLDKMLEKIADFYESEVETLIGGMGKLIEPLILVFIGGIVGSIMLAMYLPIFKLAGGTD